MESQRKGSWRVQTQETNMMLLFWMGLWEGRSLKGRRQCGQEAGLKLSLNVPGQQQKSLTEQLPQNHSKMTPTTLPRKGGLSKRTDGRNLSFSSHCAPPAQEGLGYQGRQDAEGCGGPGTSLSSSQVPLSVLVLSSAVTLEMSWLGRKKIVAQPGSSGCGLDFSGSGEPGDTDLFLGCHFLQTKSPKYMLVGAC